MISVHRPMNPLRRRTYAPGWFTPERSGAVLRTALFWAVLAFGLAGCQRGDPLDTKVGAATPLSFQQWRADVIQRLTTNQVRDLDTAVQEIRYKIMADGYSGTDPVNEVFRDRVTGKTLRQLVEMGYTAKIDRIEHDHAALSNFINQNAQLVTRPGDLASADYLADRRRQQEDRLRKMEDELEETRKQMKDFGLTPPSPKPKVDLAPPGPNVLEDHPDTMPQLEHR